MVTRSTTLLRAMARRLGGERRRRIAAEYDRDVLRAECAQLEKIVIEQAVHATRLRAAKGDTT